MFSIAKLTVLPIIIININFPYNQGIWNTLKYQLGYEVLKFRLVWL